MKFINRHALGIHLTMLVPPGRWNAAALVQTDEQLLHVSRYIHLNPLTSYVVKDFESLKKYPWSSLAEYFGTSNTGICSTDLILGLFKNKIDHERFLQDQASYQQELQKIRHLITE